jgi:AcrR family transcriptional regulator
MPSLVELDRPKAESADTRCLILQVAERLFREIGYRKTTVADIARSLRMSPANVYRFFDSKGSINEAVAERLIGELEAELMAIVEGPGTAADRLARFLAATHELTTSRFTAARRMHEMVEVAMAESWQVVSDHIQHMNVMIARLVADGVASGEFDVADPAVAARCVHTSFVRFCHPALIVQCADEPGPTVEEITAFILRGLGHRG